MRSLRQVPPYVWPAVFGFLIAFVALPVLGSVATGSALAVLLVVGLAMRLRRVRRRRSDGSGAAPG